MCTDATDVAIVYALIQLADRLGMRVVAEGVEDEETLAALESFDCELVQGYLISRPVPAAELEGLLRDQFGEDLSAPAAVVAELLADASPDAVADPPAELAA
jgi:EAL domain-containing protein (putative c-di-GMP-specific phosphodiesterase class I)